MSVMLILEAAGRSFVMGLIIWFALRALRMKQVRAQRAAWLLALGGALAMPLLAGLGLGPQVLPAAAPPAQHLAPVVSGAAAGASLSPLVSIFFAYAAVSAVLLLRLMLGLRAALRIRREAAPLATADAGLDVRISSAIGSPVTIRSTVVLPASVTTWSEERLRIVLSHERAHVHQRDFFVLLAAGLHCALFWFSPFSWWLRRQLADLGEALSDHAASQQADSRASYAEVLLSFASTSAPRAAVAMARSSNLSARIERLLSDGFPQYFASRPRTLLAAAAVSLMALAAASSVARVEAATHGFVHSDEMYAGIEPGSEPPATTQASLEPSPAELAPPEPPAPPARKAARTAAVPAVPSPPPPPAPAAPASARSRSIDAYAEREVAMAQREIAREAQRLAREQARLGADLSRQRADLGETMARTHERMEAAQKQLALTMQSAEMRSLKDQQSELSRQMNELVQRQMKLIDQALKEFNAGIERSLHENLEQPKT